MLNLASVLLPWLSLVVRGDLYGGDSVAYFEDPFEDMDWIPHSIDDKEFDFDWNLAEMDYDENFSLFDSYSSVRDSNKPDKDIDLEGACKFDLSSHPECDYSQYDKGLCLWMSHVDAYKYTSSRPLSPECVEHLIDFFTNASEHPFEYFHDLRRECDTDLKNFCSNTTAEVSALACLRSHMDTISSRPCLDELNHLNSWASMNESWWSPTLWRDCASQRVPGSLCESYTGLSEFRDCLDEHRFEIQDTQCRKSLFESDLQAAPNPYMLRRNVADSCRQESRKFCSDVSFEDENQLFCLFRASKRHADSSAQFSPTCASAIQSTVASMDSDYRLNGPIRKFCRTTIQTFCKDEKIDNDKFLHEKDSVMTCLKRVFLFNEQHHHASAVTDYLETDACMQTIRRSVLLASLDWEVNSSLHSNCLQDYHKLLHRIATKDTSLRDAGSCAGETPHQCLQSHFHDIKNGECQKAVALQSQLEALDQDFKPQLLRACALAIDELDCSSSSSSSIVDCLYERIEYIQDPHCRGAIRHDFELSDRDYRLSYSLSIVCAKDREFLCGPNSVADPTSVLKCMIEHVDQIKDPECEDDVSRLAFVAMNEEEEMMEKSVCSKDVEIFCKSTQSVHACLLNRLTELSSKCAENVLNLHSTTSALEGMERVLNNVCSSVLVTGECKGVATDRLVDKVECIRKIDRRHQYGDQTIPRACLDQLVAVETLLSADYRTNPELKADCEMDLSTLCGAGGGGIGGGIGQSSTPNHIIDNPQLMCLVSNRKNIRNSDCKRHIVSTIYRMSDDVQYVPGMRSVCGDDIEKFCRNIQPGNGQLHACLREHFDSISHDCQSQEFVVQQIESISAVTTSSCQVELETVCSQSLGGSQLHCLWRNVDEVSGECREAVRTEMKGKIGNIWLDPFLYTRCRSTVNEFIEDENNFRDKCPSHLVKLPVPLNGLIPLPSNYTQALNGEHVVCLANNRAKIADRSCLKLVEKIIRDEMKDPVLLQNGLYTQCKRDLSVNGGACSHTDPFDTSEQWRCLQKNFEQKTLTSNVCLEGVRRALQMSVSDVQFNPEISSKCEPEIERFYCKQVSSVNVIPCLVKKFKQTIDSEIAHEFVPFSEQCAEAIKRLPEFADIGMDHLINQLVEKGDDEEEVVDPLPSVETLRLLRAEAVAAEDTGDAPTRSIELSGALAFVSLASLFIVIAGVLYKVYRWRMNKGYMVIVEKS